MQTSPSRQPADKLIEEGLMNSIATHDRRFPTDFTETIEKPGPPAPVVKLPEDSSLHAAFLTNLRKPRRNRVCFEMNFPISGEQQNVRIDLDCHPTGKRRRFQRRNSKTAAMLFPSKVRNPSQSLMSPLSKKPNELPWEQMSHDQETIAQQLFNEMKEYQGNLSNGHTPNAQS
jgi:hypothetical protein